jgi:hypothetical protein
MYDFRMPKQQSASSHTARDPLFHFVLMPFFLLNFILTIFVAIHTREHRLLHWWIVLVAAGFFLILAKIRMYSLANQDRIIRLEERLRIAALVPAADAPKLSTKQLIALRFASDAELPALVARTLAENLDPKAIKQSIATWRPDHHRI